jgi:hypothetical protein
MSVAPEAMQKASWCGGPCLVYGMNVSVMFSLGWLRTNSSVE